MTVVVQCVVGQPPVITGTAESVAGISDGSSVVTCNAFAGLRIGLKRGGVRVPGIDPLNGGVYYTKNLDDNFITLTSSFVDGEFVYIETIL